MSFVLIIARIRKKNKHKCKMFSFGARIKLSFFRTPLETQIFLNSGCNQSFRFRSYFSLISFTEANHQSFLAGNPPQLEYFPQ